jgi:protein phosphatase-4 regulatory subunit 3
MYEYYSSLLPLILVDDKDFTKSRFHFRNFISNEVQFKQVVPISDPKILAKIVETHRIQYLKDVALARLLDDGTFSTLNTLIQVNHNELVEYFKSDPTYLTRVCDILRDKEVSVESKADAVAFMHELCAIVKGLQPNIRSNFYHKLAEIGFFQLIETTLETDHAGIRLKMTSTLHMILENEVSLIRSFAVQREEFILALVKRFHEETDPGTQSLTIECIRIMLDSSVAEVLTSLLRNEFNGSRTGLRKTLNCWTLFRIFTPLESTNYLSRCCQ